MLVKATGGISREVGGLCALEAGAEVCGNSLVRTIGGCSNVEIAFWPDSKTALPHAADEVSNDPPTECIELAVELLRGRGCDVWEPFLGRLKSGRLAVVDRLSKDSREPGVGTMMPFAV